jgi:hypothetical protein
MNDAESFALNDAGHRESSASEQHPRAHGSSLPVGNLGRAPFSAAPEEMPGFKSVPLPGRALSNSLPSDPSFNLQRTLGTLRGFLPYLQKLLPLLDGNFATALVSLLTPHPQAAQPAAPVSLEPVESRLNELAKHHNELSNQIVEQNSSLKRVEDQLDMVREATDRNTLEQQELLEDLKSVGNKVNFFAYLALFLLAASIFLNVVMYLHILRVLP